MVKNWYDDTDDLDRRIRSLETNLPKPTPLRQLYTAAAFGARLSRGETAEEAAKGAKEDAEVLIRIEVEERQRSQDKFRDSMRRINEAGLKEDGWTLDGYTWSRPGDPKKYGFEEAAHMNMMERLTKMRNT